MIGHQLGDGGIVSLDGVVVAVLPGSFFRVRLSDGELAICCVSGLMRLNRISIVCGDQVTCEFSISDLSRGRIRYRYTGDGPELRPRRRRKAREGRGRFAMEMEC